MFLKKILRALTDPSKWKYCFEQIFLWIKQVVRYGNLRLNPNTKNYWNDRLDNYGNFWRIEPYENILDILPKDEKFSLLDVGCAIGDGCEFISENFPFANITGVDFSDVGIKKARQKARDKGLDIKYKIMDILKDPLLDKYDYITIIETIEHFYDPFYVIDKCLEVVKRSIIVSAPYTPGRGSERTYSVDEHVYTFDDDTFSKYNSRIVKKVNFSDNSEEIIIYEISP